MLIQVWLGPERPGWGPEMPGWGPERPGWGPGRIYRQTFGWTHPLLDM